MDRAFRLIFWGAVITLFDLNIGWLNLFPNFLGYILIAVGLSKVIAQNPDGADSARRANTIAWVLAAYTLVTLFTGGVFGNVTRFVLSAVFMTADMLMSYFVLSAGACDASKETAAAQQRNYLVIAAAAIVSCCTAMLLPGLWWVTVVLGFTAKLYFIYLCHAIKGQYRASLSDYADPSALP